jgi:hypothetical protein
MLFSTSHLKKRIRFTLPPKASPDQQNHGDQEENGADDRVETLELVNHQVDEVQDEPETMRLKQSSTNHLQDHVDDHDDEVQAGSVAETSLSEAGLAAIPLVAEQGADDQADDDLEQLDDAAVCLKRALIN